ncbi:MAG: L-arabinose isomerase [Dysgonomonadaceae bacterium]|nr:L-arabinose isomerase [Dysgonamonadaceae bacterium]HOV35796.1 L-arabinose isomerase [Dysgonamonadaceae bacterium]HQG07409.1 L-arabinose isomerase [Dysgonamonadaceae bacterium]HQI43078.1 L-arabinose isomerase [Dysgonamonadaceae bacterium]
MSFQNYEVWFVTGAQLLYGGDAVIAVDAHSNEMVNGLNNSGNLPVKIVYKGTVNSSAEISKTFSDANNDPKCIGVITWMHTFSPAKMWIHGLQNFKKPLLHFHTQFNKEVPWNEIDMDFMNLNQSAHGDREFGHIVTRMRKNRKVVVGHWQDKKAQDRIAVWMRVAAAWADAQDMIIVRFGDNMNNVAVTDGDKVEAEMRLGYHVDYYPVGDLVAYQDKVTDSEIAEMVKQYESEYDFAPNVQVGGKDRGQVFEAARIEIALRRFLKDKGAKAFTTNFDELHGLNQLPGLAAQRLMAEGYGFGAEGDWKTAALLRSMWFMGQGLEGGCSFLEDYTYHFDGERSAILQAHMLEVSPLISAGKPQMNVFPLGIGGKADPARLIFTAKPGQGIAATIVDMGNRFRMIVNQVDLIEPKPLPKLPVACALWIPQPSLEVGAAAWILAGGTHHTCFSSALTMEYLDDYAEIAGIEKVEIDNNTTIPEFKKELHLNEIYYLLNKALM